MTNATKRDYWAAERLLMDACPRCQSARSQVAAAGYSVSSVPDHDDAFCAAQSIEHAGPSTYGHPMKYVRVNV